MNKKDAFKVMCNLYENYGLKFLKSVIFGRCYTCGNREKSIKVRKTNTRFPDEISNYKFECIGCHNKGERFREKEARKYYEAILIN